MGRMTVSVKEDTVSRWYGQRQHQINQRWTFNQPDHSVPYLCLSCRVPLSLSLFSSLPSSFSVNHAPRFWDEATKVRGDGGKYVRSGLVTKVCMEPSNLRRRCRGDV